MTARTLVECAVKLLGLYLIVWTLKMLLQTVRYTMHSAGDVLLLLLVVLWLLFPLWLILKSAFVARLLRVRDEPLGLPETPEERWYTAAVVTAGFVLLLHRLLALLGSGVNLVQALAFPSEFGAYHFPLPAVFAGVFLNLVVVLLCLGLIYKARAVGHWLYQRQQAAADAPRES